jgi:SAM-dependent methyltransferase
MIDLAKRLIPDREKMAVALYQIASRVHWPAREDALRQAFAYLELRGQRLVDIGCGPGLLAKTARDLGLTYIGIDPDRAAIENARQKSTEGVEFAVANASDVADFIQAEDIAILNGVCHHLSDRELSLVLSSLKACSGVFILDHQLDQATSLLNRFLQQNDRGRFVRPSSAFDPLPGYRTSYRVIFSIPSKRLPAWRYFCNFYVPVKVHA